MTLDERYLDLMKRVLINTIYPEADMNCAGNPPTLYPASEEERLKGSIWPQYAHTMIGWDRLSNIQDCLKTVIIEGVPGDVLEAGIWRGGACIFMQAMLKAYNADRLLYLADSFEGLPPPEHPKDNGVYLNLYPQLSISLETVAKNFKKYNLLDDDSTSTSNNIRYIKGWFKDTLPTANVGQLALLRLDCDLYESTMTALNSLYDKVVKGGYVIVDDYYCLDTCTWAVNDFRQNKNITTPIIQVDWSAGYWRKD